MNTKTAEKVTKLSHEGMDDILLRHPTQADGRAIWQLVHDSGELDENSPYAYLLVSTHFRETSLVAEMDGEIVGFVAGYIPPMSLDTVFVWQIGVSKTARGRGLARHILRTLVRCPACREVSYMEATVTPSNFPSQKLFASFANKEGVECNVSPCFTESDFPGKSHQGENLFRIGPLRVHKEQ